MTSTTQRTDQADRSDLTRAVREELAVAAPDVGPDVADDADLRADLGVDSLSVLELVARLELRFDLAVPDEDWPALSTIAAIAAYVERALDAA